MRICAFLAAAILCVNAFGINVLTWDTNVISSPVTVYKAEKLGEGSGDSFTLPFLPSGSMVLVVGQGTFVPVTNFLTVFTTNLITLTNTVTTTNSHTSTNSVYLTNSVTSTNFVVALVTNTVTKTNFVTKTNIITITNHVGPGKPPKR